MSCIDGRTERFLPRGSTIRGEDAGDWDRRAEGCDRIIVCVTGVGGVSDRGGSNDRGRVAGMAVRAAIFEMVMRNTHVAMEQR